LHSQQLRPRKDNEHPTDLLRKRCGRPLSEEFAKRIKQLARLEAFKDASRCSVSSFVDVPTGDMPFI
jgi:hypothetical protein